MLAQSAIDPQDRAVAIMVLAGLPLVGLGLLGLGRMRARADARLRHEVSRLFSAILMYDVPPGQRRRDVIRALDWAGYPAITIDAADLRRVLVLCPCHDTMGRQVVRAVIEAVPSVAPLAVKFADEA